MSTDAPQAHIPQAEVELDEAAVAAVEAEAGPLPPDRFLDRELSWLAFNERVLQLSEDPELPVLERAKFIAISITAIEIASPSQIFASCCFQKSNRRSMSASASASCRPSTSISCLLRPWPPATRRCPRPRPSF